MKLFDQLIMYKAIVLFYAYASSYAFHQWIFSGKPLREAYNEYVGDLTSAILKSHSNEED
jgi:hypothetical protein